MSPGWQLCFDFDTHKALLNIILVLLFWAALTGATPLLNAPFDKSTDGQGWWGALVHIRLNPSYYKHTLKNKRLFGQSQSPGAWGSSVCLPRLSLLYSGPFFCFVFFVRASTLPRSFGQDIKRDPRGSDSQPFPTRRIHTVTTANCLDYDNSAWTRRKSGKVGEKSLTEHSVKENNHRYQKTQTEQIEPDYHSSYSLDGEHFKPVNFWALPYSELCLFLPVIGSHYFMGRLEPLHSGI